MIVKGKIKVIFEKQTFDSGFEKRDFVVTTTEQYPQDILLSFYKDKCGILDTYKVNESVVVEANLRGSEYNGRYYVNLNAWKIDKGEVVEEDTQPKESVTDEDGDTLPF